MTTPRNRRITRYEARTWAALAAAGGLALGIFLGPTLAIAQSPAPITNGAVAEHTITVSGTGIVFVTPDLADVTLGIQVERGTVTAARNAAAEAMVAVIAGLRNLGIADADIQTTMLSISPTYDYSVERPRVTGYQVTNLVAIHVRDLDQLAAVVDDSVAAGATTVNGITFRVADPTTGERQAREAAVRDARARAETLASAAGVTITGVASISESFSAPWYWYGGDRQGEAPTPVLPGTSEISVSVTMVFLIP